MKFIHYIFFFGFLQISFAQSTSFFENSFTEETTDQEKFSIYLDSLDKYLYRDALIAEAALIECQKLIDQKVPLPDSSLFKFVSQNIYLQHSKAAPLEAYKIIAEHENTVDSIKISNAQKAIFYYLKAFTYMSIGDLEAAQNAYYQNIERAKVNKDTSSQIRSLISLGQLFNDENQYEEALECFEKVLAFDEKFFRPSTKTLTYIEFGEAYDRAGQRQKSLEHYQIAYELAEKNNLQVLKLDILVQKGKIYLDDNKIAAAEGIYKQLLKVNEGAQDENLIQDRQEFLAKLYWAQKKYTQALDIYKEIVANDPPPNFYDLMDAYENAHKVCQEMGDFELAYSYLLKFNAIKKQVDEDASKQKTSYLNIKYETEQKEKENAILSAKVRQNQAESQLLYLWLTLLFLILAILVGAFYQKQRYSKKLEAEVFNRTINLRKSNELLNKSYKEAQEFNRILSHDLKEPLRSIVRFSQLADREIEHNGKTKEYLNFVIGGGKQLEHLISSVNVFQKVNSIDTNVTNTINIKELFNNIKNSVQENYPDKNIDLSFNTDATIQGSLDTLRPVFQIIIDNAVNYNEQKTASIQIDYQLNHGKHRFEISDNGIGIAPRYHNQVFEMFKRLNVRSHYEGSGLGLSIAKKLIERINGTISLLRSQEKQGSTFFVSFPETAVVPQKQATFSRQA